MSASLVGSEMCIRDRLSKRRGGANKAGTASLALLQNCVSSTPCRTCVEAVSYTHLTLPTICSV
eukprot:11663578-Alexandrium_andersonii.AAC.1